VTHSACGLARGACGPACLPNFYKRNVGGRKRSARGIVVLEDGRSCRDGGIRVAVEDEIEMLDRSGGWW